MGNVVFTGSKCMWKCWLRMCSAQVVGDLEHAWYFNCGRYLNPLYLLTI